MEGPRRNAVAVLWKEQIVTSVTVEAFAIGRENSEMYASAYQEIPESQYTLCTKCGRPQFLTRTTFEQVVWFEASPPVGLVRGMLADFTWHGRDDEAILSDRLKHVLQPLLDDHSLREIAQTQMFEIPGANERKPLWELADLPVARLDLETSGVSIIAECQECSWRTFDIDGKTRLVVDADTWRNWNFFSVAEFQMMFVTAPVIECLNSFSATNFRVRRTAIIR